MTPNSEFSSTNIPSWHSSNDKSFSYFSPFSTITQEYGFKWPEFFCNLCYVRPCIHLALFFWKVFISFTPACVLNIHHQNSPTSSSSPTRSPASSSSAPQVSPITSHDSTTQKGRKPILNSGGDQLKAKKVTNWVKKSGFQNAICSSVRKAENL